jgi:hypothetical protein
VPISFLSGPGPARDKTVSFSFGPPAEPAAGSSRVDTSEVTPRDRLKTSCVIYFKNGTLRIFTLTEPLRTDGGLYKPHPTGQIREYYKNWVGRSCQKNHFFALSIGGVGTVLRPPLLKSPSEGLKPETIDGRQLAGERISSISSSWTDPEKTVRVDHSRPSDGKSESRTKS